MHDWKATKTWKPKSRRYHRPRRKILWRTRWTCSKCGLIKEANHEISDSKEPHELDVPSPNFEYVADQGKTRLKCEDLMIKKVMES